MKYKDFPKESNSDSDSVKPEYSAEKNYSIGTSSGPHQKGMVNGDTTNTFSDTQKANFGLVSRSPL